MGSPYSARNCRVIFDFGGDDIELLANQVVIHTNADRIDVTNFKSGNDPATGLFYGSWLPGVVSAEVQIEAFESDDDAETLWATGVTAGTEGFDLYITTDRNVVGDDKRWFFPIFTVIDVSTDAEAHGAVKHNLRVRNRGRWFYPGEANA